MSAASLRILHYTPWNVSCGIAGYAADLVEGLGENGVTNKVTPIAYAQNKGLTESQVWQEYVHLAEEVQAYDALHVQHEFSFFHGRTSDESNERFHDFLHHLLNNTDRPIVVTFHEELPPPIAPPPAIGIKAKIKSAIKKTIAAAQKLLTRPKTKKNCWSLFQKHPDRLAAIAHTSHTCSVYIGAGIPADRVHLLPMGIKGRTPNLDVPQVEARRLLDIPADCKLLSLFGFITTRKGPQIAVEALKSLPPEYRLVMIGGIHPMSMEPIIENILSIWKDEDPDRLIITDHLPAHEVDLWQAASDVCLAPYHDGASGSAGITWLISSGRPVIATKTRTFRELADQSRAMLLVTPHCPRELAWQIKRLMSKPQLAAELVRNARSYSVAHSWKQTGGRVINIYEQLLSHNQQATAPRPVHQAAA